MLLKWQETVIECLAFGGTAGVASGSLALLYRSGFASSEVFSLAGAFIGAGSAVAGAIWLADRQQDRAHRRECDILRHVVVALLKRLEPAISTAKIRFDEEKTWRDAIDPLYSYSRDAPDLFRDALEKATTLDLRERLAIRLLMTELVEFHSLYEASYVPSTEVPRSKRSTFDETLLELKRMATDLLDALDMG